MTVPRHNIPKAHKRKFYYNSKAVSEIILGYNFFELNELDFNNSNQKCQIVKLKENKKNKRKFLKFILTNSISTSMITLKGKPLQI